jgi:PAS domain S-box-containing protein
MARLPSELLERLVDASPDIIVGTDQCGTVSYYNDGAQVTLGYSREEIIGCDVVKLYPSREEARRVMTAMRDPAVGERGRVVNFETCFISKSGRTIDVAISGVILYDGDGQELGTIGFAKDIRELKRRDKLAVLGEIAVGLAHEINNPLAAIVNHLELIGRYLRTIAPPDDLEIQSARIDAAGLEIARIEAHLDQLRVMSEQERYASKEYIGGARMIDLESGAGADDDFPLSGRMILVVDDDAAVRHSVCEILRAERCRVVSVPDGTSAVGELERQSFDLVLSDVVMSGMDGYDLFQETKRRWPGTPVVLMTAFYYDKNHVLKRSRIAGLEGVLFKKPVHPGRLRATLMSLIGAAEAGRATAHAPAHR